MYAYIVLSFQELLKLFWKLGVCFLANYSLLVCPPHIHVMQFANKLNSEGCVRVGDVLPWINLSPLAWHSPLAPTSSICIFVLVCSIRPFLHLCFDRYGSVTRNLLHGIHSTEYVPRNLYYGICSTVSLPVLLLFKGQGALKSSIAGVEGTVEV